MPTTEDPKPQPVPDRGRVTIDAVVWQMIDQTLADLPYRVTAPIVNALQQTGGVK